MRARSKLLAYAQLVRLPNLFTAVADPLAGWFAISGGGDPAWQLFALAGASLCLYASGIVFNDCFDYTLDLRERPERPLPRGDVSRTAAAVLASTLMIAGLGLTALVGSVAFAIGAFLAFMIFFYNSCAKRFALLGPLALGTCRFANFLLGMRALPPKLWLLPVVLGVYVAGVTMIARRETEHVSLQPLVARLLLGIIVLDAALVLTSPLGDWIGAWLILSLLIPAAALQRLFAMT